MSRRRLLLGGLASLSSGVAMAALPIPVSNRLSFRVMRDGSAIGDHTLMFERSGDALTVSIAVSFVAGAGPIALLRYKHRATEYWKNGQVMSLDAETNDNGTPEHVTVRRDESGLVVEGSKALRYVAPARALPGTYWNRGMLDAPFINTQDGRLMRPVVTSAGSERLEVTGGWVEARRYTLRGDVNLDTFYDVTASWAGLRFVAKDGAEIRYLRA